MNFAQLVAGVITETNRPDLGFVSDQGTGEIPQSCFAALMELHTMDYFYKDIQEQTITFAQTSYLQSLDTTTIPNFRSMAFIRKWDPSYQSYENDPTTQPPSSQYPISQVLAGIDIVDIGDIFDRLYGNERTNIAYQAGYNMNIKSNTPLTYIIASYYAFPNLDMGNNGVNMVSWIANEYPYAVIYKAASNTFVAQGQQENARKYDSPEAQGGLVASHIRNLKNSNITAKGS